MVHEVGMHLLSSFGVQHLWNTQARVESGNGIGIDIYV